MEYRPLGRSGLVVSELGLGGNNFGRRLDLEQSRLVVDAALEHGVTFIDTAEAYGTSPGDSESIVGTLLSGRRDQVVLATKFAHPTARIDHGNASGRRAGRKAIRLAIEGSLRRLRTDWIDLYQLHRYDLETPFEETYSALEDLATEGKVRYFGHSCLHSWQLAEAQHIAHAHCGRAFVSAQYHWNMLDRWVETDIAVTAQHYGVGILPYFPLAQGMLTGKIPSRDAIPESARLRTTPELVTHERLAKVDRLSQWAASHGRSVLEVAFGGLTTHPAVSSVIAGASSPEQVAENAAAIGWKPTAADRVELDEISPAPPWHE